MSTDRPRTQPLSRRHIPRRTLLAALPGAVMLSCAPALAQDADPWPRRFAHTYGETVLNAPATRVVSLGYTTQDPLLAVGVVPLAVRGWFGDMPHGIWPWASDLLGSGAPVVLTGDAGMETIVAAAPDLIVAIGAGLSRAEYDLLSQIAPVLVQEAGVAPNATRWDAMTHTVARATGRDAAGAEAIARTEAAFAAARARHPDWAGKTAIAAYNAGGETGIFTPIDTRARFLQSLGFKVAPALADFAGENFYAPLSPEDLSPLDTDVLLWIATGANVADLVALPGRRALKVHQQGGEVYADGVTSAALTFGSVLSLPYALAQLEAEIAAAADGDPATVVPSALAAGLMP